MSLYHLGMDPYSRGLSLVADRNWKAGSAVLFSHIHSSEKKTLKDEICEKKNFKMIHYL